MAPPISSYSCSSYSNFPQSSSSSSTSQSSNYLPPATSVALEQIVQLNKPERETVPFSRDPKVFFAPFEVDTRLFTEQDVDLIYSLFETTKFNPDICLNDLLALRLYQLLKELTAPWPGAIQEKHQSNWAVFYLMGYLGLLRQSVENEIPQSKAAKQCHFAPGTSFRILRKLTEDLLEEEKVQTSSKKQKAPQYSPARREQLWKEWKTIQKFLEKCLVQKNSYKMLSGCTLILCSGSEQMISTSEDEVSQAIHNLQLYLEIMVISQKECFKNNLISFKDDRFELLLSKAASLGRLKKPEEIAKKSKEILDFISKAIPEIQKEMEIGGSHTADLREKLPSYSLWSRNERMQQTPIFYKFEAYLQKNNLLSLQFCWLSDCKKVIEESIITPLDSSFDISRPYTERISLNFTTILEELLKACSNSASLSDSFSGQITEKKLQNIKYNFFLSLHDIKHLSAIIRLCDLLKDTYGELFLNSPETIRFVTLLDRLTNKALDEICDLDLQNYEKEALFQELLWLCRLFVWLHDLDNLSNPDRESSELNIFPDKLLQLLALNTSPKMSQFDAEILPDLPSLQSLEISQSFSSDAKLEFLSLSTEEMSEKARPIQLESAAVKSVQQTKKTETLQQVSSKKLKKQAPPPAKPKSSSKATAPLPAARFEGVSPQDLMQTSKRRKVEAILAALGLKPIRHGNHTVWKDETNPEICTVVPHHDEIKAGTRRAMVRQITPKD